MPEYEIVRWDIQPVEGDEQVELVIESSDGNRWEYGIPYSKSSGRYTFEEIDVIANDFGEDVAEEITERLDQVVGELSD
jgi:hypothetical protein